MTQATTFEEAIVLSKTLTKIPSNSDLLNLYAYYKQATVGNVTGTKPSMLEVKELAKYKAWEALKDMSKEDAEAAYVALVNQLLMA